MSDNGKPTKTDNYRAFLLGMLTATIHHREIFEITGIGTMEDGAPYVSITDNGGDTFLVTLAVIDTGEEAES